MEAANPAENAKTYGQEALDLDITDILMPERDGVKALLELRSQHPINKTIVISGEAPKFLPIVEDLGADRGIAKPFNNREVLDTVTALLQDG